MTLSLELVHVVFLNDHKQEKYYNKNIPHKKGIPLPAHIKKNRSNPAFVRRKGKPSEKHNKVNEVSKQSSVRGLKYNKSDQIKWERNKYVQHDVQ